MNLLIYLYLVHFIADYLLQSHKIIEMKKKGYFGVFVHCIIHLFVLVSLLSPFFHLKSIWIGVAIIFVTHNIIDQTKIVLDKKYPKLKLQLYLIDQALHLTIITAVACYIGNVEPNIPLSTLGLYSDRSFITYILTLVITTYFYDVTRYFVITRNNKKKYKRDYKMMLRNTFIVSIAYAVYWMSI